MVRVIFCTVITIEACNRITVFVEDLPLDFASSTPFAVKIAARDSIDLLVAQRLQWVIAYSFLL